MKKLKLSAMNLSGIEVLTREQMKNVLGKMLGGSGDDGCITTYMGCNYFNGSVTCDYHVVCPTDTRDLCEFTCINGDGWQCLG